MLATAASLLLASLQPLVGLVTSALPARIVRLLQHSTQIIVAHPLLGPAGSLGWSCETFVLRVLMLATPASLLLASLCILGGPAGSLGWSCDIFVLRVLMLATPASLLLASL